MRRGRPAHPDILTPREWEVLQLIREGKTNQEIADILGITERGARYHVSEILSKLNVQTRQDAARWQPTAPRSRGFSSVFPLEIARRAIQTIMHFKAASAALAALTLAIVGVSGFLVLRHGASRHAPGASVPSTNATAAACQQLGNCTNIPQQRFSTLEEAEAHASFQARLPTYVPEGFQPYSVELTRYTTGPIDEKVHNDSITVYYRNSSHNELIISQGFPAAFAFVVYGGQNGDLLSKAPTSAKGSITVNGTTAKWMRGSAVPVGSSPDDNEAFIPDKDLLNTGGIILGWEVGRFGPGWELSPDRTQVLTGSPLSYTITSNSLSLDVLKRIAESVNFD